MKCRPNIKHYQSCAIPTITRSNWQNKQPFVAHVVKFQAMGMKLPCSQTGNCDPAAARWTSQTSQLVGGEEQQFKKKKKDKKHHVEQRWPSVLPFSSKLLLNKTDFFSLKTKKKAARSNISRLQVGVCFPVVPGWLGGGSVEAGGCRIEEARWGGGGGREGPPGGKRGGNITPGGGGAHTGEGGRVLG